MPELSVSRSNALAAAGVLLVVLVVAGRFLLGAGAATSSADAGVALGAEQIRAAPAPPVVVHVVGAVQLPGLYRLARGKRVADAVARAGGATAKADLALINLAALVSDGQQVVVPARAPPGAAPAAGEASGGPVHLNSATIEQLDALPGRRSRHRAEDRRLPREARSVQHRSASSTRFQGSGRRGSSSSRSSSRRDARARALAAAPARGVARRRAGACERASRLERPPRRGRRLRGCVARGRIGVRAHAWRCSPSPLRSSGGGGAARGSTRSTAASCSATSAQAATRWSS